MALRIYTPQWREEHDLVAFPFIDKATLSNGTQMLLPATIIDALLHVIGGLERMRLSRVEVSTTSVTIWVGDEVEPLRAYGTFDTSDPPSMLALVDLYGRPAGVLVSEPLRWGLFAAWGQGTFDFEVEQTEFCATCVVPTPERALRGILLDDGTLLSGDVWLVGGDGVALRREVAEIPAADGCGSQQVVVIRVDAVGDPLFKRKLCGSAGFVTPTLLRELVFRDESREITVGPDAYGDVQVSNHDDLAADTVLRLTPTAQGFSIQTVGRTVDGL